MIFCPQKYKETLNQKLFFENALKKQAIFDGRPPHTLCGNQKGKQESGLINTMEKMQ